MKVGILSDIHANYFALKSVLRDCRREEIERLLVLGDTIGYYYWPEETIEMLLNYDPDAIIIKGNHEQVLCDQDHKSLVKYFEKFGSGLKYALNMKRDLLDFILSRPNKLSFTLDGLKITIAHGTIEKNDEYIYPNTEMKKLETIPRNNDFIFYGHTHYPFFYAMGSRCLANPGSVGQPRDFGYIASYFILNTKNRVLVPRRVLFDIQPLVDMAVSVDPHVPYLANIFWRNR